MVRYSKKLYKFERFEKSKRKDKKYDAILKNKETDKEVRLPFGQKNMEQYRDTTGLGLYTNLDHNDKNRRRLFRNRFSNLKQKQDWRKFYTPLEMSYKFLW
jgi:hypothetical protein